MTKLAMQIRKKWNVLVMTGLSLLGATSVSAQGVQSKNTVVKDADAAAFVAEVEGLIRRRSDAGVQTSVWIGGVDEQPWFEFESAKARPTASSIKAFYLVELFDTYRDKLDSPLPGAAEVLQDDHPAISHFTPEQRDEIRRELTNASIRRIGQVMIGGTGASNAVYNAAANLTTAALGGPKQLMQRIHRRDAEFADVAVRRYMMRNRKEFGDNESTATALAALYRKLATGSLAGLDDATLQAVRTVLFKESSEELGRWYWKGGSLMTDPLTHVHAGWWQTPPGNLIYVVMASTPLADGDDAQAEFNKLEKSNIQLTEAAISAGRALMTEKQQEKSR